jgi:hypothetical protein
MHLNRDPQTVRKLTGGMFLLLLIFPLLVLAQQRQTPLPDAGKEEQSASLQEKFTLVEPDQRPVHDDAKAVFSFGLVVIGLLLWMILQGYRRLQQDKQIVQQFHRERLQLLSCIAELDDRYAQGIIQDSVYQQERPPLKQRLLEVTSQCRNRL